MEEKCQGSERATIVWNFPGQKEKWLQSEHPPVSWSCEPGPPEECGNPGTWTINTQPVGVNGCGFWGYWEGFYDYKWSSSVTRSRQISFAGFKNDSPYIQGKSIFSNCDNRKIRDIADNSPGNLQVNFEASGQKTTTVNGVSRDDPIIRVVFSNNLYYSYIYSSCREQDMLFSPIRSISDLKDIIISKSFIPSDAQAQEKGYLKIYDARGQIYEERVEANCPQFKAICGRCPPNTCECHHGNRVCCFDSTTGVLVKSFLV